MGLPGKLKAKRQSLTFEITASKHLHDHGRYFLLLFLVYREKQASVNMITCSSVTTSMLR